jgi:hypothetical protein
VLAEICLGLPQLVHTMSLRITKIKGVPLFYEDDDPGHQERLTYHIDNKMIYIGNITRRHCMHHERCDDAGRWQAA